MDLRFFKKKQKSAVAVDVLTGYAEWAKNYPAYAHNPFMQIEEQAVLGLMPANLGNHVCLDLACGSGRYAELMRRRQAKQLCGTDYSAHMLAQAVRSQHAQCNSHFARSGFLALPFADATFDFITCGLAVGHEKNLQGTLREISRVLRSGGVVIYSDFHPFGTLLGWQRSFTAANGATFKLEHYLHLYSDHHQACQAAGLTIQTVVEPSAGEHAPPEFQQTPVVLVIQAKKK